MKNKLIEQPSSQQVQAPRYHWTTSLCKILLLSQIFFSVFLALFPALSSVFQMDASWDTALSNVLPLLFFLIGITLCVVSGFATFLTLKPQWSPGKRIARIGLFVGGLQVLAVLIMVIIVLSFLYEGV